MARYRIGITEAGDAGLDLSWADKLDSVDGAILITKDANYKFREKALVHKDKVIVHATVTGYGGTVLEPNVPPKEMQLKNVLMLIDDGFPREKIVIRIDPIVPTENGIETAFSVFKMFMESGWFPRYRVSIVDMYSHVRERFSVSGLPLVYGNSFLPSKKQIYAVDQMLARAHELWHDIGDRYVSIECCAEPELSYAWEYGCISRNDLQLLGLYDVETDKEFCGFQRKHCKCYSGKVELLKNKSRCDHKCAYCYWK